MSRLSNRRGQGLVEYILVLALVGVACIAAVQLLGNKAQASITKSRTQISQALGV